MREYYNDRSIVDDDLKQLDKEIISNRKRKKQTRSNLLWKIDNRKQQNKKLDRLKYVSSFGVFVALLFFGYQLFTNGMSSSNEQASTAPLDNQTEHFLVLDDADESEERERIGENDYLNSPVKMAPTIDINTILPTYIPGREHAEPDRVVEVSDIADYAYADYFYPDPDNQSFSVYLAAENRTIENMMWSFEFQYRNDPMEEIEIAGHPAILRLEAEDVAHFSALHIFVENHIITLSTRGFEKEEILKSANSMDLSGL